MKSSGPCFRPSRPPLRDRGGGLFPFLPFPSLPFPPLRGPTVGTCIPVIESKGHMRLVPLERTRCHFLLAIFLVPALLTLLPYSSFTLLDLPILPRVLALLIPLLLFLYSANVFSIFLLRSTCARSQPLSSHLHAVMYPLLVFPTLSSALIPTLLFPRRISSIFPHWNRCLFIRVPFTTRAHPAPCFLPAILSVFLFGAPSSPRICAWFSLPLSISVRLRQHAPHLCASAYQSFVPFFPLLCPVYHPSPCPSDSFVTIGIRMPPSRLASHFSPTYVSISHRSSSHFLPTINTLSRSVYILLATCEILNPDKISIWIFAYYIPERKGNVYIICI